MDYTQIVAISQSGFGGLEPINRVGSPINAIQFHLFIFNRVLEGYIIHGSPTLPRRVNFVVGLAEFLDPLLDTIFFRGGQPAQEFDGLKSLVASHQNPREIFFVIKVFVQPMRIGVATLCGIGKGTPRLFLPGRLGIGFASLRRKLSWKFKALVGSAFWGEFCGGGKFLD